MLNPIFTQQIPLLKLAFVFALGIVSNQFLHSFFGESMVLHGTFALVMITVVIGQWNLFHFQIKSIACWLLIYLLGCLSYSATVSKKNDRRAELPLLSIGIEKRIEIESVKETGKSFVVEGRIISFKVDSNLIVADNCGTIIYIKKDLISQQLLPGQLLITSQVFQFIVPNNASAFYFFDQYLIGKGIEYRAFLNRESNYYIDHDYEYSWMHTIRYPMRTWASLKLRNSLSERSNQVAQALILGERSFLDQELKSEFAKSGIIHILAVSGLHVSFVVYILFHILNWVFYRSDSYSPLKVVLLILALLFYAELTGGAIPVWRATIMTISFLVAKSINKRFSTLNLLGLAAFLILVIDPGQLFSVSFQLSFAAVIGIITFFPAISKIWTPESWLLRKARDIISIGIAAQVSTFPIALYHFEQVSLTSPLSGLFAIPLAAFILWVGILALLCPMSLKVILSFLSETLEVAIKSLIELSSWVADVPISTLSSYTLHVTEALLFVLSVILIAYYLHAKKSQALLMASLLLLAQALTHRYFLYYPN